MSTVNQNAIQIQHVKDQILEAKKSGDSQTKIQKLQQLLDKLI